VRLTGAPVNAELPRSSRLASRRPSRPRKRASGSAPFAASLGRLLLLTDAGDESREWTDTDKQELKRLMSDQR
jgi:hypothetical protein